MKLGLEDSAHLVSILFSISLSSNYLSLKDKRSCLLRPSDYSISFNLGLKRSIFPKSRGSRPKVSITSNL